MSEITVPDQTPDPVVALAQRVRALREAAGLTQRGLAREILYSRTIVNRVEQGRWPVSWASLQAIVNGCGVPDAELPEWEVLWTEASAATAHLPRHRPQLVPMAAARPRPRTTVSLEKTPAKVSLKKSPAQLEASRNAARRRRDGINGYRPANYRKELYLPPPTVGYTVYGFTTALQRLRASVDNPSYRAIAARAGMFSVPRWDGEEYETDQIEISHTTLHDLFRPGRAEIKWPVVLAFLAGCGLNYDEIDYWHRAFRRVEQRPRIKPLRRKNPHAEPPYVDLSTVTSVPDFANALKELARVSVRSFDEVIGAAEKHVGAQIYRRSTLFSRFRDAIKDECLPEREFVIAYLRGCYCTTISKFCVPDCNSDLIEPWLRIYDKLYRSQLAVPA